MEDLHQKKKRKEEIEGGREEEKKEGKEKEGEGRRGERRRGSDEGRRGEEFHEESQCAASVEVEIGTQSSITRECLPLSTNCSRRDSCQEALRNLRKLLLIILL